MPITDHAAYLAHAFQTPDQIIEQARDTIGDLKFDVFVGRGFSGALVVPILAGAFGKRFGIIRKPSEHGHSFRAFEGTLGACWLFVDDLIGTGETFVLTEEAVKERAKASKFRTRCVGAYLYGDAYGGATVLDKPALESRVASHRKYRADRAKRQREREARRS